MSFWNDGYALDIDAYAGKSYRSIHIGDFMMRSQDAAKPPIRVDCDFVEVMASDFLFRTDAANAAAASHPGLPEFIKSLSSYFHTPGAEIDGPVFIEPRFAAKTDAGAADEKAQTSSWLSLKAIEFSGGAPIQCVSMKSQPDFEPPAGARLFVSDFRTIPFEAGSVDTLVALDFIDAVGLGALKEPPEPQGWRRALRSLAASLKPGGRLLGCARIGDCECVVFDSLRVLTRALLLTELRDLSLVEERLLHASPQGNDEWLGDGKYRPWCFMFERPGG